MVRSQYFGYAGLTSHTEAESIGSMDERCRPVRNGIPMAIVIRVSEHATRIDANLTNQLTKET